LHFLTIEKEQNNYSKSFTFCFLVVVVAIFIPGSTKNKLSRTNQHENKTRKTIQQQNDIRYDMQKLNIEIYQNAKLKCMVTTP